MSEPPGGTDQPRRLRLAGLHHVSAVVADLGRTTAFYRDVLGLPLAREAHNDDDPDARHFWFGDPDGGGPLVSFMEYPALEHGRVGVGSTHHFAFAVASADELEGWRDWLRSQGVECTEVLERGGLRSVYLRDPDGHMLELTAPAG